MKKAFFGFLVGVAAVLTLIAAPAFSIAGEVIPLADEVDLDVRSTKEFEFHLTEIPEENWNVLGHQVRLSLDARLRWAGLGGYSSGMTVRVNGQGVEGRYLMNKTLSTTLRTGDVFDWAHTGSSSYRLYYSANFSDETRSTIKDTYIYGFIEDDQDPFLFVWNITPYVRPGTNSLSITSGGQGRGVALGDVFVEIGEPIRSMNEDLLVRPAPTGPLEEYTPSLTPEIGAIGVSGRGSIAFMAEEHTFNLRSRTSLPGGAWTHDLNIREELIRLGSGESFDASWDGHGYTVERRITLNPDHIAVADTVRNTGGELLGVIFENRLGLLGNPGKILLGGFERPLKRYSGGRHPTALVQYEHTAIGLLAEDDILRLHGEYTQEDDAIVLADRSLGIAPGESHTLEWSIYVLPGGDYWDFINAVRRKWSVNFTLEGPLSAPVGRHYLPIMWYEGLTADYLRNWLKDEFNNNVAFIATHPAQDATVAAARATKDNPRLYHGTAILHAQRWLSNVRKLVSLMQEVDPSVRICAYIHPNLSTEVGYENMYRDSVALDRSGNPARSAYTPLPGLFIPTLNNSYGSALREVYRYLVDDVGANLYIDEITAGIPGRAPYAEWDGCTVRIDPSTHKVVRKESMSALLMQPWFEELMEYLAARGRTAYANSTPPTRTMTNWRLQHFTEDTGHSGIISTHLSTPLAFAYRKGPSGFRHLMESLDYGGIRFRRWGEDGTWMDYLFPLTPIELRAGMVFAEERILTNRSGRFGWGDRSGAEVYVYNGQGELVEDPDVKEVQDGGKVFNEIRMPSDHFAILVRKNR